MSDTNTTPAPSADLIDRLVRASTGTLSTVLLKRGLRNVWLRGPRPIRPGQPRLAGLHVAFCASSRRSGYAGQLGVTDQHPRRH